MPLEIVDQADSAFARAQTGLLFNLPEPAHGEPQRTAGVSLCMIVRNEERFLAECLASARDAVDEINVVDTGSTDRTVEIARSFGANVIFREWRNDFAWARNESLEMATRRWTIVLDADEELTPESAVLLRALAETPAALTGVYVKIQNHVDDVSGVASTMTHMLPRVFPSTPRIRYRSVIHENIFVDGERHIVGVTSPIVIRHKGYAAEVMTSRDKGARNQPLLERAMREAADDAFSWFNFGVAAVAAGDHETGAEVLERMFAMPGPAAAVLPDRLGDARARVRRRARRLRSCARDDRRRARALARSRERHLHASLSPRARAPLRRGARGLRAGDDRPRPRGQLRHGRRRDLHVEGAAQHRDDVRERGPSGRGGAVVRTRARREAARRPPAASARERVREDGSVLRRGPAVPRDRARRR